jgi:hypothetical protein
VNEETLHEQLKKIYRLAKVGLELCKQGKCIDVKSFFRYIMDIYENNTTN